MASKITAAVVVALSVKINRNEKKECWIKKKCGCLDAYFSLVKELHTEDA
jgi:hypothetical protein